MLLNARLRQFFRVESSRIRRAYSSSRKRNKKKKECSIRVLLAHHIRHLFTHRVWLVVFIILCTYRQPTNRAYKYLPLSTSTVLQLYTYPLKIFNYILVFHNVFNSVSVPWIWPPLPLSPFDGRVSVVGLPVHFDAVCAWKECVVVTVLCDILIVGRYVDRWLYYVKAFLTEFYAAIKVLFRLRMRQNVVTYFL